MGVVTEVDGDLTSVRSFTLLVEGDLMTFIPAPDGTFEFPLTHLREHVRDGSPVQVTWQRVDGANLALAVADG